MTDASFDPKDHVGESVTFRGTAWTAAAGATVSVSGTNRPIYIGGLDTWSKELEGKAVEVSGVLRLRDRQVAPAEEGDLPSHGLDTETFVLDGADWTPAGDG
jgi:hypothetical protein